MVRLLLHYDADPNCRDYLGNTPLDIAVNIRHMPITCLLLSAGSILPFDLGEHHVTKLIGKKLYIIKYTKSDEERAKLTYELNGIIFLLRAHIHIKPICGNVRTQENKQDQIETLSDACSRLSLSNSDQIQDHVKYLLADINYLDTSSSKGNRI
jgi:ankyrin repeat protein